MFSDPILTLITQFQFSSSDDAEGSCKKNSHLQSDFSVLHRDYNKEAELSHVTKARFSVDGEPRPPSCEDEHYAFQNNYNIISPFHKGISKAIQCVITNVDIHMSIRLHTTLKQVLVHLKDIIWYRQKKGSNLVYCNCRVCPKIYICLQTSGLLQTGLTEHKTAVKKGEVDTSTVKWIGATSTQLSSLKKTTRHCHLES